MLKQSLDEQSINIMKCLESELALRKKIVFKTFCISSLLFSLSRTLMEVRPFGSSWHLAFRKGPGDPSVCKGNGMVAAGSLHLFCHRRSVSVITLTQEKSQFYLLMCQTIILNLIALEIIVRC